ncbi:hypothetical protein [Streptomyces sp. NPDC093514]|uniref:effector-associated constant component EACC1 n=1 Tax=Streptomyces sp. NPDC093514 TaxID=3366039 RepID=UPI0037FA61BD
MRTYKVTIAGSSAAGELHSLHSWLQYDDEVRQHADISLHAAPPRSNELGGLTDLLQLVTDNAWNTVMFVTAVVTWRRSRPSHPSITIQRGEITVTVDGGGSEEISRIADALDREDDTECEPDGIGEGYTEVDPNEPGEGSSSNS